MVTSVIDIGNDVTDTLDDWKGIVYGVGDKLKQKSLQMFNFKTSSNNFTQSSGLWIIDASIYDLTKMWDYADYVSEDRESYQAPSIVVNSKTAIDALDTNKHTLAMLKIWDDKVKLDRSEIYAWNANKADWILIEKRTIQSSILFGSDLIARDEDEDVRDSRAWI